MAEVRARIIAFDDFSDKRAKMFIIGSVHQDIVSMCDDSGLSKRQSTAEVFSASSGNLVWFKG